MKKTSKIESKKSLKTVSSLSTNLPKKRSVQNQANRVLESLVETEVTHSLLETQPPSYDEVCPPSYLYILIIALIFVFSLSLQYSYVSLPINVYVLSLYLTSV